MKDHNPHNNARKRSRPVPSMTPDDGMTTGINPSMGKSTWRRYLPLAVLIAGLVAILVVMWRYDIRLDERFWIRMADHHDLIEDWTHARQANRRAIVAG